MYEPKFEITPHLLKLISQASELRGWIGQSVIDVAWLPTLQKETVVRLAHSSTAIEGNPLTLPEVEALERGERIGRGVIAEREVLNYLASMRWIWKRGTAKTIEESDVLRLHRLLMENILPNNQIGRYKTKPNRIIDSKGVTIYTPPGAPQVKPLTLDLLTWLNSSRCKVLHPIIVSGIAHHQLVSIHPFSDGNGRISRALGVWLLYSRGFDTHHLFALDEYFSNNREMYYQKIQQARELDDILTYWLEYVAQGVLETLQKTKERILSLQLNLCLPKITLTKRQEDFLRFLRDKGRVRTSDLEKAFKITRARVNQIMKPLLDAGLVIRDGQTRATSYHLK